LISSSAFTCANQLWSRLPRELQLQHTRGPDRDAGRWLDVLGLVGRWLQRYRDVYSVTITTATTVTATFTL
jgi:hypothetical protein